MGSTNNCDVWYLFELEIVEIHPLFSSRVASSPSYDVKGASGVPEDSHKPCSGCLGRDTFANAAAKVAPAVVNISVPQSTHFFLKKWYSSSSSFSNPPTLSFLLNRRKLHMIDLYLV